MIIGAVGVQRFEGYSDADKLNKLGAVSFSDSVKFDDNAWPLASVSGGLDYDIDADRRIDDSPTQIFGTVLAIMSGSRLKQGAFALNPLTECAYQFVREYVNLLSNAELGNALNNLAPELLSDVEEDTVLDYGDILSWNRRSTAVFVGGKAALDSLALAMTMGENQETVQARAMAVTSRKAPSGTRVRDGGWQLSMANRSIDHPLTT